MFGEISGGGGFSNNQESRPGGSQNLYQQSEGAYRLDQNGVFMAGDADKSTNVD